MSSFLSLALRRLSLDRGLCCKIFCIGLVFLFYELESLNLVLKDLVLDEARIQTARQEVKDVCS